VVESGRCELEMREVVRLDEEDDHALTAGRRGRDEQRTSVFGI
jgi:hypothetical protein